MPSKKIYASGLAAILLSGCATTAPYPTRYQAGDVDAPSSANATCSNHIDKPQVIDCLARRAQGWEAKGARIRGQGFLVGSFAIPAAATAIGLAAEGDPNHAIGPLGLLTGALIAHTSNYASNDQAAVAEAAASAYGCLIKQAGDWRGELYGALVQARKGLVTDRDILARDVNPAHPLSRPPGPTPAVASRMSPANLATATGLIAEITSTINAGVADQAGIDPAVLAGPDAAVLQATDVVLAAGVHEDAVGANLVGQAVEIDRRATLAMAKLAPSAASVAASAPGALNGFLVQFEPKPVSPPAPAPAAPAPAAPAGGAGAGAAGGAPPPPPPPPLPPAEQDRIIASLRAQLETAKTYKTAAHAALETFKKHVADFNTQQAAFQLAADAYKPASVAATCVVETFGGAVALAVQGGSPVTLSAGGKAVFVLLGGVGYPRLLNQPEGVILTPTWFGPTTKFEVTVADMSAKGPWDIMFTDNAATATILTVRVQKPPS